MNELQELRAQLAEIRAQRDNLVKINRILRDRPDLGDRAKSMDKILKENDRMRACLRKLIDREVCCFEGWKVKEIAREGLFGDFDGNIEGATEGAG